MTSRAVLEFAPYLVSLRLGFSMRRQLPERPVGSYPAFSPSPRPRLSPLPRLSVFCGTVRRIALAPTIRPRLSRGNLAREPGLSSPTQAPERWSAP